MSKPKILTRITVPTGGWDLDYTVSVSSSLDTNVTTTMPAGDYYVAWDGQDSDFLWELQKAIHTDLSGASVFNSTANHAVTFQIETDHKITIVFSGSLFRGTGNDVSIDWTSSDGPSIAAVLGFDSSAADTSTSSDNPELPGDYHHGYGWYADEDGWIPSLAIEDMAIAETMQAVTYTGHARAQNMTNRFRNSLQLDFVKRDRMYSRGVSYGSAPLAPHKRNKGLECWWREARQGIEFRVYREGAVQALTRAVAQGTYSSEPSTSTWADTSISWGTEPFEHTGMLVQGKALLSATNHFWWRGYMTSHTATVATMPNPSTECWDATGWFNGAATPNDVWYMLDQRYQTYVVNLSEMQSFAPTELPAMDRYSITIPMLRFVS